MDIIASISQRDLEIAIFIKLALEFLLGALAGAAIIIPLGGLLYDVLTREGPLLFKPGQFYALTALVGCICLVILTIAGRMEVERAAFLAIGLTFLLRLLTIRVDWQRRAVVGEQGQTEDTWHGRYVTLARRKRGMFRTVEFFHKSSTAA